MVTGKPDEDTMGKGKMKASSVQPPERQTKRNTVLALEELIVEDTKDA